MITKANYYEKIKGVDFSNLPKALKESKDFVDEITRNGKSWSAVDSDPDIKEMVKLYFEALEESLESKKVIPGSGKDSKTTKVKPHSSYTKKSSRADSHRTDPKGKAKAESKNTDVTEIEQITPELKFLRRFVNMFGKKKDRNQIRLFISALQKAIRERRINLKSQFAKEIGEIQDALIKLHSKFQNEKHRIEVNFSESTLNRYLQLIGKQIEYASIKFIKSYIALQGKIIPREKAVNLYNRITKAIEKGKLDKDDKYWNEIQKAIKNLKDFIKNAGRSGVLKIASQELNGLNGILAGCGCSQQVELNGFTQVPENTIMNSLDAVQLKFEKLGLTDKWLEFIGNASRYFTMMIYGLPKMGKSILAVDFAGYLARNHGRALYVAKEEGIDDTLIEKLDSVAHENLDVSNYLPESLEAYNFIFLDSVTKLGLHPSELNQLQEQYPDKAFIYIFQTTKDGKFRGSNQFQHDVDVVVEVPEKGRAIQYGRFNQGGELEIFANAGN